MQLLTVLCVYVQHLQLFGSLSNVFFFKPMLMYQSKQYMFCSCRFLKVIENDLCTQPVKSIGQYKLYPQVPQLLNNTMMLNMSPELNSDRGHSS